MNWYLLALKKYATFTGRSRRKEYWFFLLFYMIIVLALSFLDSMIGITLLAGIYVLAMLVPSLAVLVRRLHDTGRSGWWALIGLIPLIGGIVLLVFCVMDSEAGANAYGENPKAAG